ncbi:MAG: hypothetical protein OXL68_11945 [Paracoccaceae bacterium]|nr:hypothetical protein [Paracoccaceae bacterium]
MKTVLAAGHVPLAPEARCDHAVTSLDTGTRKSRSGWPIVLPPGLPASLQEAVERLFGSSISGWNDPFLMRSPENVRGEFSLTALVYGLHRPISLPGLLPPLAATRG